MRVTANRQLCQGAGLCVLTAPEVFDQDDDGVVVVTEQNPSDGVEVEVRTAEDICPAQAIAVAD